MGFIKPESLKLLRILACDMTQKELADRLGVTQGLISKVENGTVPMSQEIKQRVKAIFVSAGISEEHANQLTALIQEKERNDYRETDKEQSESHS